MELVQQLAQPVPSKRLPLPVLHHELLLMMGMEGTEGRSDFLAEVASEAGKRCASRVPRDAWQQALEDRIRWRLVGQGK